MKSDQLQTEVEYGYGKVENTNEVAEYVHRGG
jgi:hypothetical protein